MKVDFEEIGDESRIWIHQISRGLNQEEEKVLIKKIETFLEEWTAHGKGLKAAASVIEGRLLIIAADESHADASGCSIDSLVAFLRKLQLDMEIDLFSRENIFYQSNAELKSMDLHEFKKKVGDNEISLDVKMYNTTILRKGQIETDLLIPVGESWLMRMLQMH